MILLLTWAELSPKQKAAAVKHRTDYLMGLTLDGRVNWGKSQPLFDAAVERAHFMHTPWFAAAYIMDACGDLLTQVATSEAQQLLYINPKFDTTISDCVLLND